VIAPESIKEYKLVLLAIGEEEVGWEKVVALRILTEITACDVPIPSEIVPIDPEISTSAGHIKEERPCFWIVVWCAKKSGSP
jgi:hypothetical protein